jgi:hypothetical protein
MKPFGSADTGKDGDAMAREKGREEGFGESDRGVCMR